MKIAKSYFRDHIILFILTLNVFIGLLSAVIVLLRLSSSHGSSYIVQYRSSLGVSAFKTGNVVDMMIFAVFALLILLITFVMSFRTYKINKSLSLVVLGLGVPLQILSIVVSNALFVLH